MKTITTCLIGGFLAVCLPSCSNIGSGSHQAFKSRSDYKKTSEIYRNETLIQKATTTNTHVKIDLSDQRAQLYVGDQVALDTPCCTGKASKRTPTGTFRITKKVRNKRSNIFGSLYRGSRKVYGGDRRKYRGRYTRYVGSPLPYWMRLTDGGIGMHYSAYVHRYPKSNGCIRMPMDGVKTIYANTRVGTPVKVVY